jgi:hypothetical protein
MPLFKQIILLERQKNKIKPCAHLIGEEIKKCSIFSFSIYINQFLILIKSEWENEG